MQHSGFLTLISIQLSLLCYAIFVGLLIAGFRPSQFRSRLRPLWTVACILFVCHVISAFHFTHGWSHRSAMDKTARQTAELFGRGFPEGVYFSYLFMLTWIADVVYWWIKPDKYEHRSFTTNVAVHGYLFFIAFNGTVIFEAGVSRFCGLIATLIFIVLLVRRYSRRSAARDAQLKS